MGIFGKRSLSPVQRPTKNHLLRSISSGVPLSRIRQLHAFSHKLLSNPDLDTMARGLFEVASEVTAVKAITFRVRNQTSGIFEPIACYNLDQAEWRLAAPLGGVGVSRAAIKTKQPAVITDLAAHAHVQSIAFVQKYNLLAYLGIPLLSAERVEGVIGYYSGAPRAFDQEESEYLGLVSDIVALALENAIRPASRAGEIPAARQRSAGTDQAKGEFLNVMSHEFRTPLSLIMGHAGMMREGLLGDINEEQRSSLDRIMENSDSLLSMVLSILQVSRIEAGGISLVARSIAVHDIFNELKGDFAGQVNERRKIVWYCSPDLPPLKVDRERLKDILRHLIDNAVKFTAHGRIVISAEQIAHPPEIRFTVADTGVGIPTEALSFIFDKFRQSDGSGTRAFDGAGLGLYIAKKYTDLLGGELSVVSEVGYGSTFTLKIPVSG
jgi:signal transduction histidine kinase